MRYRLLGQTGLYVSELALGTMNYGGAGYFANMGSLGQREVDAQIKLAVDNGINLIDTADVYSFGQSETLVGQAIRNLGLPRDELIIATKAFARMGSGVNQLGLSRHHLFNAVDASLKRLQLQHIDLFQIHGADPLTPLEETLSALDDLVSAGKIRHIGLCNMPGWQIMKANGISERHGHKRFASVQAYYSLAGRDVEREVIPVVEDQHMGLLVWSPLAGGLLSGKYQAGQAQGRRSEADFPPVAPERAESCLQALQAVADDLQTGQAQVALAWLLARQAISSVIIGARTHQQLEDNLSASRLVLSQAQLELLNRASELPTEYPGWMLAFSSQDRLTPPQR
ncbi:aldo/keto reductase [Pseudomonas aeruginosa]|uniref:aldo/keto reductase n=1 Tax=Pseudomonas aeruginosa TaxID=287 RepID=UPI000707A050|nr:aldo/keto reductase [Pseudomonas aeruginosa]KQK61068.1 aldo/keto reductase [Pseudomonas aeruginosa]KQK66969.1 aldo/keto reductase [Pseudomonas aeruginosa]